MSENTKPILPIIHMNGTSAKTLLEDYREAMNAVQAAKEALQKVEFNARDYYPEPGLWDKALQERREMFEKLTGVYEDLQAIAVHCYENLRP